MTSATLTILIGSLLLILNVSVLFYQLLRLTRINKVIKEMEKREQAKHEEETFQKYCPSCKMVHGYHPSEILYQTIMGTHHDAVICKTCNKVLFL